MLDSHNNVTARRVDGAKRKEGCLDLLGQVDDNTSHDLVLLHAFVDPIIQEQCKSM